MLRHKSRLLILFLFLQQTAAAQTVEFNRDVRPILSENCFHCHGPDKESRAAGLRLDRREDATDYVIVPGDAEASELVARISSDDADLVMPPVDSERSLTKQQIATLRRWIDQGAAYQSHWSFVPPREVSPPDLPTDDADTSPIDRFIEREIRQQGLNASPPADRETLIRRASFDLTGLPPTPEQIDAFVTDPSADAYAKLLDRLLASESFGERMASDWLDVARYSDTYGYQVDRDRRVWPWRDWVIKAFNSNLPYDQFLVEQIAGDLLPGATDHQILATTFNRLHPQKVEGGSVPEEFRTEYVADRTQTFATALMGLTFECCRCHNHKYDPFSQAEYYQLSSFFDNIDEAGLYSFFTQSVPTPTLSLPTQSQESQLNRLKATVRAAQSRLESAMRKTTPAAETWASEWLKDSGLPEVENKFATPVLSLDFEQPKAPNQSIEGVVGRGVRLTGDDGIETKIGNFQRFEPFSVSLWVKTPDVKQRAVVFHRSRAWTDAASRGYQLLIEDGRLSWSLIHFWPGNAVRIRTEEQLPIDQWVHVVVTSDGSSQADGLSIQIDGEPAVTEAVRDRLTKQITGGGGDTITIGQRFRDRGFRGGSVDEMHVFECELTELEIDLLAAAVPPNQWEDESAREVANTSAATVAEHYLQRIDKRIQSAKRDLEEARRELCAMQDSLAEIMVMRETERERQTSLLRRGLYDQPAQAVKSDTPDALPPFPEDAPRNRLGLAKWLTDPRHPLTSRIAVNRLWQICFGTGLVRTPEDFGSQGDPPTHSELLDWLAVDFVRHGWDVKRMLKQIMLTDAYRRSSKPAGPDVTSADPQNLWLARFPSYRLPAEMLRDNALAVSGRLVPKVGGPPVKPYELEASFKPSERGEGADLYRRSLYTYWKRTAPAPAMLTLDASKRDVCRVRRERTSSPLQAFVLMNGPQYVEAARGLAERLLIANDDDPEAVLAATYRWLTSHRPSAEERKVLMDLFEEQVDYFQHHPERAEEYLQIGEATPIARLDPIRTAATTVVASTLMNFDLCVMKR